MFIFGPVQRRRRRRSLNSNSPPAPPPLPLPSPPPPKYWDGGINICILLSFPEPTASLLKLKIPGRTLNRLLHMVKSDASEGRIRYVRHQHYDISQSDSDSNSDGETDEDHQFYTYSLDPELNGPFSTELDTDGESCAIGSVVYCVSCPSASCDKQGSHGIHFCDLTQKQPRLPQWNLTKPLPSHRSFPFLVTVNKELYVIENPGYLSQPKRPPSVWLFDPVEECCKEVVPFSAFPKADASNLKVAAMGQKILVLDKMSETQYYFDTVNPAWIPFDDHGLQPHISDILMKPVPVVEHSTLYWLDIYGDIRAFNWENYQIFVGSIVGFGHECDVRELPRSGCVILIHLKDELFCLIWQEFSPQLHLTSKLHLTVLRICLDNTSSSSTLYDSPHLTASVVACFCYHLDGLFLIKAAHLLA